MTIEEARLTLQDNFGYLSQEHPRILEALRVALDVLSQPSLPSNLDEAAEEFGKRQGVELAPFAKKFFKAGAEWMAGQGCTVEVDEGYFINNPRNDRREGKFHKYYSSVFGHSKKITVTPGDNLIIQIRKKQ